MIAAVAFVVIVGGVVFFLLQSARRQGPGAGAPPLRSDATAGVSGGLTADATARGLRLCNKTASRVGVAIGYKENRQWITEGWWNVASDTCETLVAGPLVSRFYYVYAVDYDQGGVWGGKAAMCTRDKMFTIQRHRGLRRARLRAQRLLRGRHRRAEELDRPVDRARRPAPMRTGTGG